MTKTNDSHNHLPVVVLVVEIWHINASNNNNSNNLLNCLHRQFLHYINLHMIDVYSRHFVLRLTLGVGAGQERPY